MCLQQIIKWLVERGKAQIADLFNCCCCLPLQMAVGRRKRQRRREPWKAAGAASTIRASTRVSLFYFLFVFVRMARQQLSIGGKKKYSIVHRPLARRRSRRIARDDRRANRVNNLTGNWQTFGVNGLVSFPPPPPPRMNEPLTGGGDRGTNC